MPHFVDDSTDLPDGKADAAPRKGAAENSVTAAEWNETMQAMYDLRDRVVTTGVQTFTGDKTFSGEIVVDGSIQAANISTSGALDGSSLSLDIESAGAPGNYTPADEKRSGRCELAVGESEIVITLPGVTADDCCYAQLAEADATATQILRAVTTTDTITISANATATGTPRVNWFLITDGG